VFDNSDQIAGGMQPPSAMLDDRSAVVTYTVFSE
jgi:hypothetical protein